VYKLHYKLLGKGLIKLRNIAVNYDFLLLRSSCVTTLENTTIGWKIPFAIVLKSIDEGIYDNDGNASLLPL
jgi:hypothetical protein